MWKLRKGICACGVEFETTAPNRIRCEECAKIYNNYCTKCLKQQSQYARNLSFEDYRLHVLRVREERKAFIEKRNQVKKASDYNKTLAKHTKFRK